MTLSYKNRIAFYYMIATAVMMAIAFTAIYLLVQETVVRNLDSDLSYEANKHTKEIQFSGDSLLFINKAEWEEREHHHVEVNPVFIQIIDQKGRLMDKSPNLRGDLLPFKKSEFGGHFDSQINNRAIRQIQLQIERDGEIKGFLLAAMSSESAISILEKLRYVLFVSYLILLFGLYFFSRFLAGRSIKPVQEVTNTITQITKNNLKERVGLPPNKDEIYALSSGFNALLERIENALERERQFTSDASHELRTPLATIRGTLEVLIRKPRDQNEYEEKIKFSLQEIEKITSTIDQLLLLARLDSAIAPKDNHLISLVTILNESISHHEKQILGKNLSVSFRFDETKSHLVPAYCSNLIIENILSNAVKYSKNNGSLQILVNEINGRVTCSIIDDGIGIKEEDLHQIHNSFFRSDALNHKNIQGNGLGLSIVKKCIQALQANLKIESTLDKGTKVMIEF